MVKRSAQPVVRLAQPLGRIGDVLAVGQRHIGDAGDFQGVQQQGVHGVEILHPPDMGQRGGQHPAFAIAARKNPHRAFADQIGDPGQIIRGDRQQGEVDHMRAVQRLALAGQQLGADGRGVHQRGRHRRQRVQPAAGGLGALDQQLGNGGHFHTVAGLLAIGVKAAHPPHPGKHRFLNARLAAVGQQRLGADFALAQHLIHQRQLFAVQPGQLAHAALARLPARRQRGQLANQFNGAAQVADVFRTGQRRHDKALDFAGQRHIGQIRVFRLRARAQGHHRQRKRFHAQPPAFGPATLMPMLGARPTGRARISWTSCRYSPQLRRPAITPT